MSRIVGIDLGTTNSLVAYVDEKTGLPRVIPDRDGQVLLPSIVSFTSEGVLVGAAAKRQLVRRPEATVYSVKRLMGRGYDDVKEELPYLPFTVVPSEGIVKIQMGSREVTPPEVSAIVLKSLKERAEAHFGETIEKAVVTVPAYFNDSQRQATKDAGRIAGLDVVRIVNEPTAASLAYGLQRIREGLVAVYDLGGGTFDISILRVKDGIFEVLATNGNTHLGGDDFDRAVVLWLLEDVRSKHGVDLARDPEAMQELRLAAEAAKIRLSADERTALTIPFEGFTYHRDITRGELERLIEKLVDSTLTPCRMALADAGLAPSDVDEVVLVGGSTRVPLVRRRVQELFGKTAHSQLNPDEVVALGAAVQAGLFAKHAGVEDLVVTDVAPFTLGVEIAKQLGHERRGGFFLPVIERNTTIPVSRVQRVGTVEPNQTGVTVKIYQGESRRVEDNLYLGEFEVTGIPRGPAGQDIDIRFTYDLNGVLEVEAVVVETRKAFAHVVTRYAHGLTAQQIREAVQAMAKLKTHPREEAAHRFLIKRAERVFQELALAERDVLGQLLDGFEAALNLQDAAAIARHKAALEEFLDRHDAGPDGDDDEVPYEDDDDDADGP
jgi:molecular chaperone HscC